MFIGYEVLGRVAEGSTGVVWQARQVELHRLVAIKELGLALRSAPGFLERFRAEAQTLAGLDDPHVVRLYDYVEEPDRAYLVQEWVEGATLAAVLDQHGPLGPEQALGVLRGGLLGLAHAHGRGLVHRDISPANILLDSGGASKLVDFGLAAATGEAAADGASSVGTPAFSSPEAIRGEPLTARSDVYSAAVLLFLLLSGRLPYAGGVAGVLQGHLTGPVPELSSHGPQLAQLLARAMAKDPAERPSDAAALLAELEEAAKERYGVAWLGRASVAGLVGTTTAATATAAAVGGAAVAPAAQGFSYGAAGTPGLAAGLQVLAGATAARADSRILGLPKAAFIAVSALVVAAVAATVVVLTVSSGDSELAAEAERASSSDEAGAGSNPGTGSGAANASTATTTAATTPPPVPAFSGTYTVVRTVTAVTGDQSFSLQPVIVGAVGETTWEVTSACTTGLCDANVTGFTDPFSYANGTWTHERTTLIDGCIDNVSRAPVPYAVTSVLTPAAAVDPNSTTPIVAFTGIATVSTSGCNGEISITQTLQLTRTGD